MSDLTSCNGICETCGSDCAPEGKATITLQMDDGTVEECAVLTMFETDNRQYIALLPLDENGENSDGEVYIYRVTDVDGVPTLENIEDDEEYEAASDGFDQWLDELEFNDLVYNADEEGEEE